TSLKLQSTVPPPSPGPQGSPAPPAMGRAHQAPPVAGHVRRSTLMATLMQKKRSGEMRAAGIGLMSGVLVSRAITDGKILPLLWLAGAGAACYYVSLQWE